MSTLRFVGPDVHADTIAVAVAEASGEVRVLGTIPNRPESVRKMIGKLGPVNHSDVLRSRSHGLRSLLAAGRLGRGL